MTPEHAALCERLNDMDNDLGHSIWDRGCQSCAIASNAINQAAAAIERLSADIDRLKMAICGGEDVPGAINAVSVEDCERICREAEAQHGDLIDRAVAAEGRAIDYRTVAINQGWNWALCDAYGRETYAIQRGEHVDACALNAAENRARTTLKGADQ